MPHSGQGRIRDQSPLAISPAGTNILQLPLELLAFAFVNALPEIHSASDLAAPSLLQAPLNISHVCRVWRELALGIPHLWTRIHFDINTYRDRAHMRSGIQAIRVSLSRSLHQPLIININGQLDSGSPLDGRVQYMDWIEAGFSVVRPLIECQSRWHRVKIAFPTSVWQLSYDRDKKLAIDGCSSIQELSFRLHPWVQGIVPPKVGSTTIDLSKMPQLVNLRLGGVSSTFNVNAHASFRMVNLKSLHINAEPTYSMDDIFTHHTDAELPYSMDAIFALLVTSPNLEFFNLRCFSTDMAGPQPGVLHLTKLRTLKLIGHRLENLLNRLTLPTLERLEISAPSEVLENIHGVLQRTTSPVTKFALKCSLVAEAPFLHILDSLILIEELYLELWDENVAFLLDRLTVPSNTAAGITHTHACPLLRSMILKQANPAEYADAISKMLISRSPPDSEPYLPASQEQRGSRRGTGVLRSLTLVHAAGLEDSAMCFPISEEIAGLIQRGLGFVVRSRWSSNERGLFAEDMM